MKPVQALSLIVGLTLCIGLTAGCSKTPLTSLVPTSTSLIQTTATLAGTVSTDRLRTSMNTFFSGERYERSQRSVVLGQLINRLNGLAYTISTPEVTAAGAVIGQNLVLTKAGATTPQEKIIVMAHYDTVSGSPGADDNGSSCAALIEIATLLSGRTFERTLQIVFIDLEEEGLLGSLAFLNSRSGEETIIAVINMDMIGYTGPSQKTHLPAPVSVTTGDFIAVLSNMSSFQAANDFIRNFKQAGISLPSVAVRATMENELNTLFQDLVRSDHAWFWSQSIPAVFLTDTADLRTPHYHRPTDTISTLDFDFMTRVTQAVLVSTFIWAKPL